MNYNMKKTSDKKNKYKPTFNLTLPDNIYNEDELPELNTAIKLFFAYENDTKRILWTSKCIAQKEIELTEKKTIILNLIPDEHYECNKSNIKYFHVPICDDILTGEKIAESFNEILKCYKVWKNEQDNVDLIIHCKMGVHRSFTVATILSMFLHHKENSPRYYIPKNSDYDKHIDKIQSNNKYIFSAAHFNENQIEQMYKLFISVN